ncbi:MAG: restriction endonuclease [Anaerolineae bacterium]|jgi:restriction system protein
MTLWLVRAGADGEREDAALDNGLLLFGAPELPDLSRFGSKEEMRDLCAHTYGITSPHSAANCAGHLWSFARGIQPRDLVCMPLKRRAAVAVGRVTGPYRYDADASPDMHHVRPVEWLNTDIPRATLGQDLLRSLSSEHSVCRVRSENAEARVETIVETGRDPGYSAEPLSPVDGGSDDLTEAPPDLEEYARDQIVAHIGATFKGHHLARLVAALLRAQGYQTLVSPPGPDGGVDIIAGQGAMGFDPPRLCVQVKSGEGPADVRVLRELLGSMPSFGAEMGLLVSWGGFRRSVDAEARSKYFEVRLWDAGDLVEALLESYERLPEDIQAELPLKRIWTLVREEE